MKRLSKCRMALPFAAALLSLSTVASAQETEDVGLLIVNVDLRNARILNNLARDLNVNVSNIPITVQAPINVAAVVCQVQVNILALAFNRGGANCYAQQTSTALNNIVQRAINRQQ